MKFTDIINGDAFSLTSLTTTVNNVPFVPGFIGGQGIFREYGVATTSIQIEQKGTVLRPIQSSPRGAPPAQREADKRNMRALNVVRLAKEATVYADEVQGVREFGSTNQMQTVEQVIRQKTAPVVLELDMTLEMHRLGAVKGIVVDADGSVLYNLYDEFGIDEPDDVNFALNTGGTDVKGKCAALRRSIVTSLEMGPEMPTMKIVGLAGDDFFDKFTGHSTVKTAWERWNQGQALRDDFTFNWFHYAGISLYNYRGTNDDSPLSIASDEAHFYPAVPGLFECPFGPADLMETVNTLGLPRYAIPGRDPSGKNRFASVEIQSNPLAFCTRPQVLRKGVVTTSG